MSRVFGRLTNKGEAREVVPGLRALDLRASPTRLRQVWRLILSRSGVRLTCGFNLRRMRSDLGGGEASDERSL